MHSFLEIEAAIIRKRPSLQRTPEQKNLAHFLEKYGQPQRSFPSVHVTGTNGKGSVSGMIAKGIELSGKKVGLFTSPHLLSICERIQINGESISEETFAYYAKELLSEPLFFFEIVFIIAMRYFQDENIDMAVVEVGIGGEKDTTNCLASTHSIITSIGYDHKEILGDTLEKIAKEKAGIIKQGHTLVVGNAAAEFSHLFTKAGEILIAERNASYILENEAIAELALRSLGACEEIIQRALRCKPPCRFEKIGKWIFDIAHNPPAFEKLIPLLEGIDNPIFVLGFSRSKESGLCLDLLKNRAREIWIAPTDNPSLLQENELQKLAMERGIPVRTFASSEELLKEGENKVTTLVVTGSAYIMKLRDILCREILKK